MANASSDPTTELQSPVAPPTVAAGHRWRALLWVLASVTAGTAAEVCMKLGAAETASHRLSFLPWLGLSGLASKWIWAGIVLNLLGLFAWVRAIRVIPLGIAFAFSNVMYVMVPLSCWFILGEGISVRRWMGIGLIILGLIVIARPYARLEENMEHFR